MDYTIYPERVYTECIEVKEKKNDPVACAIRVVFPPKKTSNLL